MSRLSSKARRLMGLDKNDGKHPHYQIATDALNADFCLLKDDYYQFWEDMKDQKASGALVSALLDRVMDVEAKGLDKINKTLVHADLSKRFNHHEETSFLFTTNICKTLCFIGLFYPVDQSCPHFQKMLTKWNEHQKTPEIGRKVDMTLRMEVLLLGSRATPLAIDLSWFSAAEAEYSSEMRINGGLSTTRDRKSSSYNGGGGEEEVDITLSSFDDFPFATLYARRFLHSGGAQQLFEASLKLMTNLPQRLKMGTATTVRSMSALMLMLKQILTEHPIADTNALRMRLLPPLEVFCQWPVPYGLLAREMRHMVESEIRAPGTTFRKLLFEEHPMLSLAGMMKTKTVNSEKRAKQHTVWSELQHSVFVYYDTSNIRAVHLKNALIDHEQEILEASLGGGGDITTQKEKVRHEIRKRCLRSMFECSLDIVHNLETSDSGSGSETFTAGEKRKIIESGGWSMPRGKDPIRLDERDPSLIERWYEIALTIYENAAMDTTLPLTAYNQLRASQLIDLLKEIDPSLIAIPTASHSSHLLNTTKDKESAAIVRNVIGTHKPSNSIFSSPSTSNDKRLKHTESSVDKALKTARSVGKAAKLFKDLGRKASARSSSSLNVGSLHKLSLGANGPPPPPSFGFVKKMGDETSTSLKPPPVRNGFLVAHRQGLPPIQLEFQDGNSALRPPRPPLYHGSLSSQLEREKPVDKPVKNSTTQGREEQRRKLAKREKQHKETMDAKYGNWKERCVIGPTKRRYLKYPEARYNPLAPISGDLLVAALYAGSVDLSMMEEKISRERELAEFKMKEEKEDEVSGEVGKDQNGRTSLSRRRVSSVTMRLQEEDFTIQHLSRTRAITEAKQYREASKEIHSVMDRDSRKSILRICVLGSDAILHRILCNYVCFRHEYVKRFTKLSIRFYVAPTSRDGCDVASYLAKEDAWYRRQIYSPFSTTLPILPTTAETRQQRSSRGSVDEGKKKNKKTVSKNEEENENKEPSSPWIDNGTKAPNPIRMLQELMQDYIRSAKQILPICIFDCQCWEEECNDGEDDDEERPPDITIPFCMGAEIGIRARAELYRLNTKDEKIKQELDDNSLDSIIGSRGFRKSWGSNTSSSNNNDPSYVDCGAVDDITGTFTEVSPSGVPLGKKLLQDGSYYRIAVRNIPLHADVVGSRGSCSHPSFSSMDLHILSKNNCGSFPDIIAKTNKTGSTLRKSMPGCTSKRETNLVMHTMLSAGVRHQVNHLDLKSNGGAPFIVHLDGQCFGGFKRIKIVPCLSSKGEPQHFPISSFSPIV